MIWRSLLIVLLMANLLVLVLFAFSEPPAPVENDEPTPLDPSLPSLELVSELGQQATAVNDELCFTIGPLTSQMMLDNAKDRLRPFAHEIRSRQTTADIDRGWWVYLPADSRSQAIGLTRQLADQGIEDFFVVTSGERENTISLGLFEALDNARNHRAEIRSQGFDAQLRVRRESITHYWVDYRIGADERSPWRFIVRASPGATHRGIPCF